MQCIVVKSEDKLLNTERAIVMDPYLHRTHPVYAPTVCMNHVIVTKGVDFDNQNLID